MEEWKNNSQIQPVCYGYMLSAKFTWLWVGL